MQDMKAVRSFSCREFKFSVPRLVIPLSLMLLLLLGGCATPSERFDSTAGDLGFKSVMLKGDRHLHRVYLNQQAAQSDHYVELHVYLDGDGTPWEMNRWVSNDPTPRNPLILKLMAQDPTPAILLGRPCYYGLSQSQACRDALWTSHRYSSEVVESMAAALQNWLNTNNTRHLILIGYSGGGTLAALLAPRLEKTLKIVTIAANLDVTAWSRYHGYLPLEGSLNPTEAPPLSGKIEQIHLAGLSDKNVPSTIIESFSQRGNNALYVPIAEYDHACCWIDIWSDLLKKHLGPSDKTDRGDTLYERKHKAQMTRK